MANPAKEPLPQVFINFRGDELRHKFVKNLVQVLRDSGINVFIDNYERKGRRLQNLLARIKKSTIALAIFSERYCESKWCLDELVTMNKQMEEKKLVVIPIFFNVRADEVKRAANPNRKHDEEGVPDGEFTVLFKETKQKYAEEPERIERWEHAMRSVTERIGFSLSNYTRNEMSLASDIVKEVKRQLHMPTETDWSNADVVFLALFLELIFSFIIAPRYFPDLKFFKTPEWFLGILVLVLALRFWYKKNKNKPRSTSFYAVCLCVVLLISSVSILIWVLKDDLVGFLYQLKLSA